MHKDNEYRFRQVEQLCDLMTAEQLETLALEADTRGKGKDGAVLLFHYGQQPVSGIVRATVSLPQNHQRDFIFYDAEGQHVPHQILDIREEQIKICPTGKLIRFENRDVITFAFDLTLPPLGYTVLTYDLPQLIIDPVVFCEYQRFDGHTRPQGSLRTRPDELDNGVLRIRINPNGSLNVLNRQTGKQYDSLFLLEDTADAGDGWNYVAPAFKGEVVSAAAAPSVCIETDGPMAAVIRLSHRLRIPSSIDARRTRREGAEEEVPVTIEITVLRDSPRLEARIIADNTVPLHRLRLLFPTDMQTDSYYTHTPFDMCRWDVQKPDNTRGTETETNVSPMQGVMCLSAGEDTFALYSKGLYEVEVMDNPSRTVAITLFRAYMYETGQLERTEANLRRTMTFDCAIDLLPAFAPAEVALRGADYRAGIQALHTPQHPGSLPASRSLAVIESTPAGAVLSSFEHRDNAFLLRLYNAGTADCDVTVRPCRPLASAVTVDLQNRETGVLDAGDELRFSMGAKKIMTLRLQPQ